MKNTEVTNRHVLQQSFFIRVLQPSLRYDFIIKQKIQEIIENCKQVQKKNNNK